MAVPVESVEVVRRVSTSKAQQPVAVEEASSAAQHEVAEASSAEVAVVVVGEAVLPVPMDKAKREALTVPMVVTRRGREAVDRVLRALGWQTRDACIFFFCFGCMCMQSMAF